MSVDRRVRTDMRAIGQEVTPDTWTALEEVKQMADKQRTRRNVLLAVAAAVVVLVGVAVVPAVGDWWQTTSDPAPAGQEGEDAQAVNPTVEALLDEYYAAVEARDTQAVLDVLTDDAVFFNEPVAVTAERPASTVNRVVDRRIREAAGQRVDRPALVATDGPTYYISFLGVDEGTERLFVAEARLVGDEVKISEMSFLPLPPIQNR